MLSRSKHLGGSKKEIQGDSYQYMVILQKREFLEYLCVPPLDRILLYNLPSHLQQLNPLYWGDYKLYPLNWGLSD